MRNSRDIESDRLNEQLDALRTMIRRLSRRLKARIPPPTTGLYIEPCQERVNRGIADDHALLTEARKVLRDE